MTLPEKLEELALILQKRKRGFESFTKNKGKN